MKLLAIFISFALLHAQEDVKKDTPAPEKLAVPEDLLDDEHVREESGVNEFTAPSIAKVFENLQALSPLPLVDVERKISERMPLDRADLAVEIGFLIADGFLIVQENSLDRVEGLAKELSRYGKALGAGERVSSHMASLIENAKAGKRDELKKELTATQKDVQLELIALRDTDLAHLISLGGWLRALDISATAVEKKFTPERAKQLMREDIADYYTEVIGTLHPSVSERPNYVEMRGIMSALRNDMVITEKSPTTIEKVSEIHKKSQKLVALAAKRIEE